MIRAEWRLFKRYMGSISGTEHLILMTIGAIVGTAVTKGPEGFLLYPAIAFCVYLGHRWDNR